MLGRDIRAGHRNRSNLPPGVKICLDGAVETPGVPSNALHMKQDMMLVKYPLFSIRCNGMSWLPDWVIMVPSGLWINAEEFVLLGGKLGIR